MKIIANQNDIKDILSNGVVIEIDGKEYLVHVGDRLYTWQLAGGTLGKHGTMDIHIYSDIVYAIRPRYCLDGFGIDIIFKHNGLEFSSEDKFYNLFVNADDAFEASKKWMKENNPDYVYDKQKYSKLLCPDGTEEIKATYVKQ